MAIGSTLAVVSWSVRQYVSPFHPNGAAALQARKLVRCGSVGRSTCSDHGGAAATAVVVFTQVMNEHACTH
jgi:hypothetical protein